MFFVYVLQSTRNLRHYTGSAADPDVRLTQHNNGLSRSTKGGRPWKIVHLESYPTRQEAMRRERYLKTGKGRDELKMVLAARAER